MKKIPTVFQRDASRRFVIDEVTSGCEWVLDGEGIPTRKHDGTAVMIRFDGLVMHVYTRREVKDGGEFPKGFRAADFDETTGKTFGWEPAEQSGFSKIITEGLTSTRIDKVLNQVIESIDPAVWQPGTYELCGPKVNGNPEGYGRHVLIPHNPKTLERIHIPAEPPYTFDELRDVILGLADGTEGIVWHHPDGRRAKLKRRDFP